MAEAAHSWDGTNVQSLSEETEDHRRHLRMLEALLFAAVEPLSIKQIAERMPEGLDLDALLQELQTAYAGRGVNLRRADDAWAFRTAEDLAYVFKREVTAEKKLSRAALETLAVIAYHQPVTRAEIEEIRGVSLSRGTLDVLLEASWIRLRGRRRTPGRPVTFGTTPDFLDHFGLESIGDLPGLADLKAAGLLEAMVDESQEPHPSDDEALQDDEDALDLEFADLEGAENLPDEDAPERDEDIPVRNEAAPLEGEAAASEDDVAAPESEEVMSEDAMPEDAEPEDAEPEEPMSEPEESSEPEDPAPEQQEEPDRDA